MKIAAVVAILVAWTSCTEQSCFANGQRSTDERSPLNFDLVESFVLASPVASVHRYTAVSYAANDPNEDRYVVQVDSDAVFASVLDGHGGWEVAEYVNQHLIDKAATLLGNASSNDFTHIKSSLSSAFVATDDALRALLLAVFQSGHGKANHVGACTMLAYAKGSTLVVANAGDVRAVLASNDASRGLVAKPLSTDHNAKHESEQARLTAAHPNEPDVFKCKLHRNSTRVKSCRVRGILQPTRALGDFAFKYEEFNTLHASFQNGGDGFVIPQPYTPPYILADPETQVHTLTDADQFLILGSDGLWGSLSNEEAVEIVANYASRGVHFRAAQALVNRVIAKKVEKKNVTWNDIADLKPGKERRKVHDDTTVVILFFK